MKKFDILFCKLLDILVLLAFFYSFLIIGEIIHKNYISFYGLLLCILINLILLIDSQTIAMKFFDVRIVSNNNTDLKYRTMILFCLINVIYLLSIVLYLYDLYYLLNDKNNQTFISKKLGIKYLN